MIEQPLGEILESYCNVEVQNIGRLKAYIEKHKGNTGNIGEYIKAFKKQLAKAIINESLTTDDFLELTDKRFRRKEDLNKWLQELWHELYGNQIPTDEV